MDDHRTQTFRARSACIAVGIAMVMATGSMFAPAIAQAAPRSAGPAHATRAQVGSEAWQLFKATNESRGRFGLPKLKLNREMSQVARRHSAAMARAGSLFHTTDVDVYLHGITWHAWGENVGYTPNDVASMQQAFMDSPPHRHNILSGAFTHVAIGTVRANGTLWVTVFFYG